MAIKAAAKLLEQGAKKVAEATKPKSAVDSLLSGNASKQQLSLFDVAWETRAQQAAQREVGGIGASAAKGPPGRYAASVSEAADSAERAGMPKGAAASTEYAPRKAPSSTLDSLLNPAADQPMVPYQAPGGASGGGGPPGRPPSAEGALAGRSSGPAQGSGEGFADAGGGGVPPRRPTDMASLEGGAGRPYRAAQESAEDFTDAGGGGGGRIPPRPPTKEMSPPAPERGGEGGGGGGLVKYEPPGGGAKPPPPPAAAAGDSKPFNRSKVQHPSRWVDWLTAPAIGAAIGGAEGFMGYDPEKEKSQLYQQTPFIARMKSAAEGAIKGAAIGLAGVGAERAVVGIGRAGLSDDQYNMLPGPMSVTRSIMEGFKSTNLPGGTSAGAVKSSFQSGIANTSSYTAAVEMHSLRNQQTNIGRAISNVQAQPPTAQSAQQLNSLYTAAQPMAKRMQQLGNTPKYANLGDVAGTADIVKSSRGLMDVGVIAGSMVGAAAGTAVHMGRSAAKYYKEEVIAPNKKTSVQPSSSTAGALAGRIKNPWYGAGEDTGRFAIKENLNRPIAPMENMNPLSGAAFFNTNNVNAASIAGTAVAGAAITGVAASVAFGAISASAEGAPEGHPMNALNPNRNRMVSARAQLEADSSNKVRMSKPSMIGLNDAEESYYTNPNLKPQMGRHRPGMYNDDGNLTLALSGLRRG